MNAITQAEALADAALAFRCDALGEPLVEHARRVAGRMAEQSFARIVVGWLHDVVEDGEVTVAELADQFDAGIAASVDIVTRRAGETYADYIDRIAESGDGDALAVKRADLLDHLERREAIPASLARRYEKALARLDENG